MSGPGAATKPGVLEDRMARESGSNVLSLREASRSLAAAGFFGPARSLLILALEELEKGLGYRMVADGIASFDPGDRRAIWVINEEKLHTHDQNQKFALVQGFALGTFEVIHQEFRRLRGHDPSPEEFQSVIMNRDSDVSSAVAKALDSSPVKSRIESRIKVLNQMNDIKNAGFYTKRDGDSVRTPSQLTAQNYQETEEVVNSIIDENIAAVLGGFPPDIAAVMREDMAPRAPFIRGLYRGMRKAKTR